MENKRVSFLYVVVDVGNGKGENILIQLSQIVFSNLKNIDFDSNKIESLENLPRIFMPNLHRIWLRYNNLHTIANLRKCIWYHMEDIAMRNNRITDGEMLTKMTSFKICRISVRTEDIDKQCQDVSWIVKMPSSKMSIVWINNKKRIKRELLSKKIKGKYEGIQIYPEG